MTMTASKLMHALRNRPVLTSSTALALGLMFGPTHAAMAQSAYDGTGTIVFGTGDIQQDTGFDTVTVDSEQLVIDWFPNDTAVNGADIDFLPDGATALYQGGIGIANFTVLNRINANDPTRPIILNGNIISELQLGMGAFAPGGAVWFYAPGGVIIGGTATIDVGGLFLTTAEPVVDGAGNFIDGGGTTAFQQATIPTAEATIDAGAVVNLSPENSYIGLFAPNVAQSGDVTVNGSAAYIAAEAGSITFNQGLFDIEVTVGTDGDTNNIALQHNGSTTGPASSGTGDFHRIYMVAIPKNNAITMTIENSGNLGFDIAGAADVVGNSIILSTGYNVAGDTFSANPVSTQDAFLSVSGVDITSNLNARSSSGIAVATFAGSVNAASDVNLRADDIASLISNVNGNIIDVAGNLILDASAGLLTQDNVTAGTAEVIVQNGGAISTGADFIVTASAISEFRPGMRDEGSRTGGLVNFLIDSSTVTVGGNLDITANGLSDDIADSPLGSAGIGGTVNVTLSGTSSSLFVEGDFFAQADGVGGRDTNGNPNGNHDGIGGNVNLSLEAGGQTFDVTGSATLSSNGIADDTTGGNTGGNGFAGTTLVTVGDASQWLVGADVRLEAIAIAGGLNGSDNIGTVGNAIGGMAELNITGSGTFVDIGGALTLDTSATGGDTENLSPGIDTGNGGTANGGTSFVRISGGGLDVQGATELNASAFGGRGSTSGFALGGTANLLVENAAIANLAGNIDLVATALSGSNQTGTGTISDAQGGTAGILALSDGLANIIGNVTINVEGRANQLGSNGVDGGDGTGGNASISQDTQGVVNIQGDALLLANGFGAPNFGGGDNISGSGTGGDARIVVNSAGNSPGDISLFIGGNATIEANGTGGDLVNGGVRAGDGNGGLGNIGSALGRLVIEGAAFIDTSGLGGAANADGSGGNGAGGQSLVGTVTSGAIIELRSGVTLNSLGNGGQGLGSGNIGGDGIGGTAQIFADPGGTVTITNNAVLSGTATGGEGDNGADGGNASATDNRISVAGDGAVTITGNLDIFTNALGGSSGGGNSGNANGGDAVLNTASGTSAINIGGAVNLITSAQTQDADGNAGAAQAGAATIQANNGGMIDIGTTLLVNANATAGRSIISGNGGDATAGALQVFAFGADPAAINIGSIFADLSATAGDGADGGTINVDAGNGGAARSGNVSISFATADTLSTINVGSIDINSRAFGGNGGNGGSGVGSGTGDGGNGGDGGSATFGSITILGNAARGELNTGNITINAENLGGLGGNGGDSSTSLAGLGGNGGDVLAGGTIQIGNASGTVTAQTLGSANFGEIFVESNSTGGLGGNGGTAILSGTSNNGGDGGDAIGTSATLLVRGTQVTALDITFIANTFGGNGGTGLLSGNGGAGTGGTLSLLATNRFMTADRGNLIAGNVSFMNDTMGGTGNIAGIGNAGATIVDVIQSDVTLDQFIAQTNGTVGGTAIGTSVLSAVDSNITFNNDANMFVDAPLAIVTDSGIITVNGNLLIDAANFVSNVTGTDPVAPGTLSVIGNATFISGQDIILSTNLVTQNTLLLNATGNILLQDATSNDAINLLATDGNIATGALDGINGVTIATQGSGSIATGAITALNGIVDLNSALGAISTGNISSGFDIMINTADGDIAAGNLSSTGSAIISAVNGSINTGSITGASMIMATADNDINLGDLDATTSISINSLNAGVVLQDVQAGDTIDVLAASDIATGLINAGDTSTALTSANGNIDIERVIGGSIAIDAAQNVNSGLIDIAGNVEIVGGGNVTLDAVEANGGVAIEAGGLLTAGRIGSTGLINPGENFGLGLTAGTGIMTGSLSSDERIGLMTMAGDISTGNITAGRDLLVLSGGNVSLGSISAGLNPDNFIYIGDVSLASLAGPNFDPTPIFNVSPTMVNGSITFNGTISGANLLAASTGGLLANQTITLSNMLQVDTGGLASFLNAVIAPSIMVFSNDINLGASATLGNQDTDTLTLVSTNANGTFIGDGDATNAGAMSGGYILDAAEAIRLQSSDISISAANIGGLVVGDLRLTAGTAPDSNLVGTDAIFSIASMDTVRVAGTLNITGLEITNEIIFAAPLIEIATDSGSLVLEGSSPGGTLSLFGRNIHIGSTALLDQLALDPFFAGRDDLLAQATPGPNPDGTIQAGSIIFNAEETLLIQNSGSNGTIGGFFADTGGITINPTGGTGMLLDLVIHGMTVNADDTLVTGEDVRDTIFTATPAGFTETSSVNGCALTAASCAPPPPPTPPAAGPDPDAGLPDGGASDGGEEDVITTNVRDTQQDNNNQDTAETEEGVQDEEPLTEEEDQAEESSAEEEEQAEEKATSKSPISRPVSIINTRALTNSGPISEPVTSGGNPNLMGAPVSSSNVQDPLATDADIDTGASQ